LEDVVDDLAFRLQQTDVFGKLPDAARLELAKLATRHDLSANEFLCHQGFVWQYALFVGAGRLRWTMLSVGGQEYTLYTMEPGMVFWGHSIFDDQPMPASLAALKPSQVCVWHRDVIMPVLYRHPEALWETNKSLVRTMRRAREIIYGLAFHPVAGRLANLLLKQLNENTATVERDLSLNEIAAMVASTPEVVCRILHQFRDEGVLEITRTRITLNNREALERIVKLA
jgi:CRP-like cAMP-binding protein